MAARLAKVVSYSVPISNHNLHYTSQLKQMVVSYSVPISNHNYKSAFSLISALYLILFLYQTTTGQTHHYALPLLYLILFLYQTTTDINTTTSFGCCILFCSYIKPQPELQKKSSMYVVSYSVPISNHNLTTSSCLCVFCCILFCSYIKPQLMALYVGVMRSCILFCSYIKPQPSRPIMP